MDLSKFAYILMHSRLFFSKAKHLGDPFENSSTSATIEKYNYIIANKDTNPLLSYWKSWPKEAIEELRDKISSNNKDAVDRLFVSCWHMNQFESAAMWKLYSKSDESRCIVTDYSILSTVLPPICFLGTVNYIDYSTQVIDSDNSLSFITHKRRSFEHEREIRAVIWSENLKAIIQQPDAHKDKYDIAEVKSVYESIDEYGVSIPIDINSLIKAVYINPLSTKFFHRIVDDLSKRFNCHFPIINSSINETPIY